MEHIVRAQAPQRLLGVWAHPDDEAYLSAGLMDHVLRSGGEVTVVAISDGEAGFAPDDRRPASELKALRRAELVAAMAEIGVRDVRFLGLPDGAVADVLATAEGEAVAAEVSAIVHEVAPDIIVSFGADGFTGHEDHIATSHLVHRVWQDYREHGGAVQLLRAAKSTSWFDEWSRLHREHSVLMTESPIGFADHALDVVLDLEGDLLDRKRAVLAAHSSQTEGLAAAMGEATYRRWIAQETFRVEGALS